MSQLPGITRPEEEKRLADIIAIAQGKLASTKRDAAALAEELHTMLEDFDEGDKETQALWNNTDARFKEVNREIQRAAQARKKPYFGRIDFTDKSIGREEAYYIGRSVIAKDPAHPEVIDWRAPIAGLYYESALGDTSYSVKGEGKFEVNLSRKRTYEIEQDFLKDFYDSDVVANDELLTKYLARNKRAVLSEIIATIQQEQNRVIRKKPQHNLIVQGAAGSGKTTVAMHRISYILYNYELEFAPEDFYIIGSNQVLLNYITGVLPELNVYGVSQMTLEQLFIRLLYEDWDKKYQTKPVQYGVTEPIKGTSEWFHALEQFCEAYEWEILPREDVRLQKTNALLLSRAQIEKIIRENMHLSRADKITKLTEHLIAKVENEISGKYYSFSANERKHLLTYYETYFGKREWKESIFSFYDRFLLEQNAKGHKVALPEGVFDLYDLAALAYLYKRLKETQIIREAGHVVIDEAQDFGMMAYHSLKYCLSKCTYTIMGDVSQNISIDYGISDWQELRELMLPDEYDYFGLLQKSYRNTVEISRYATNILQHGTFQVYPVQPIIRHGEEVITKGFSTEDALFDEAVQTIRGWQENGLETIAVICADQKEFALAEKKLQGKISFVSGAEAALTFQTGVMLLTLEYTKGLEFDAVLILNASAENYPLADGYVKRLYVAATRALHELVVLHRGKLTDIIGKPVSEKKLKEAVVEVKEPEVRATTDEDSKTHAQLAKEQALAGEVEMAERHRIGPKRIQASAPEGINAVGRTTRVKIEGTTSTLPSYLDRRKKELGMGTPKTVLGEYGEMPDNNILHPPGHNRIDCSVRLFMKGNGFYDVISSYGTLRIQPLGDDTVRVCFVKGQSHLFEPVPKGMITGPIRYQSREGKDCLEIRMAKMSVKVDRKTGAVSFYSAKGEQLLTERPKEPRQMGNHLCWMNFDWTKKECLTAKGIQGVKDLPIGMSAKYISFGPDRTEMPFLMSDRGYSLAFLPGRKVLCCNIPMYGAYVSVEGDSPLEYYFKALTK